MLARAWPVCSSLTISSNRREAGTLARRAAAAFIGLAVALSISNPSLAVKRTTRSRRTGSSRYRLAGSPIMRNTCLRTSANPWW